MLYRRARKLPFAKVSHTLRTDFRVKQTCAEELCGFKIHRENALTRYAVVLFHTTVCASVILGNFNAYSLREKLDC